MKGKPDFLVQWRDLEAPVAPPATNETFGFASELATATDLAHLRVAHIRLPPGTRTYPPIALRDDEAFFFVLDGEPDLWIDGHVHALKEGDGVALHARTGIGHSFLNNSPTTVRLFAISEGPRQSSRAFHPVDGSANDNLRVAGRYWGDAPARKLGPHDGLTEALRGKPMPAGARKKERPDFVSHWETIIDRDENTSYPDSMEKHGPTAYFGRRARFSRIGINLEVLPPGRRTSWPHAERDEEEFVYVVSGRLDCWTEGDTHPMTEGDFVGWASGTGIAHVVINNSDEDALLLVGSEANRQRNQFFYPLHPRRNKEIGAMLWADHPKHKFGPHDGLPDAVRAKLPASVRRDPIAANAAAAYGVGNAAVKANVAQKTPAKKTKTPAPKKTSAKKAKVGPKPRRK